MGTSIALGVIMIVVMLVLFVLDVPIGVSCGLATILISLYVGMPMLKVPMATFNGLNIFSLLAIPYFIYAGSLMEHGGISRRLVAFAFTLVGHLRGGLAHVSLVACMFFAAISGSSMATTAAIGGIMVPDMTKKGYPVPFSCAVQAAGGITGVMIPPSISMVLFGVAAGVSVGGLFMAGLIPGILVGTSMMVVAWLYAKKHNLPIGEKASIKEVVVSLKEAVLALLMPVIILGGIYSGIFTPTEAAVVAVVYGFIVGVFVYKEINFVKFRSITRAAAMTTCTLGIIMGLAQYFGSLLTNFRIPHEVAGAIGDSGVNLWVTLLLINLFLLFWGCFMDVGAAIIITAPILAGIVASLGGNLIHFGVIVVVNLAIGLITPPLGLSLYIAAKIGDISFGQLIKPIASFLFVAIVVLMVITYVPQISLFLPTLLGFN